MNVFSLVVWCALVDPSVADDASPDSVRIVLPPGAGDIVKHVAGLLTRQVESRTRTRVVADGEARFTIELAVAPGDDPESFSIEDRSENGVRISGGDARGVLYGVGKFLRSSHYENGVFRPGTWRGRSGPAKTVRGVYFATHFHNFYHEAPVEEIERYVEELGLWGFNTVAVWFDMSHFPGFDSPEAQAFLARLKAILQAARRVGLETSFVVVANEGFADSPDDIRADLSGMRGASRISDICTAIPEGRRYVFENFTRLFDSLAEVRPRYLWIWPYDSGGCGCAQCRPWGTRGFLDVAEPLARLARDRLEGTQVVLSTWFFDNDEWAEFERIFARREPWFDYLMAEEHRIAARSLPGAVPVVGFPEISMHATFPWGGFGGTPLTGRARTQWDQEKHVSSGGFLYSEGIYEDLTKVVYSQLYWDDRDVHDTLREYVAFHYSPEVVDEVLQVIAVLERNHRYRWWPGKLEGVTLAENWFPSYGARPEEDPDADVAYAIVRRVDAQLPAAARHSWRWRILYLRALLDAELKGNGGAPNEACYEAFRELIKIYHAQNAEPHVRPPLP